MILTVIGSAPTPQNYLPTGDLNGCYADEHARRTRRTGLSRSADRLRPGQTGNPRRSRRDSSGARPRRRTRSRARHRRRPRTVDLGHLRAHTRHHRRRHRPATSPATTTTAGQSDLDLMKPLGCRATASRSPGHGCCRPAAGRSTRRVSTSTSASSTGCTSGASRRWPRCSTGICRRRCRIAAAGRTATARSGSPTTPTRCSRPRRRGADLAHHQRAEDDRSQGYHVRHHGAGQAGRGRGRGRDAPPRPRATAWPCRRSAPAASAGRIGSGAEPCPRLIPAGRPGSSDGHAGRRRSARTARTSIRSSAGPIPATSWLAGLPRAVGIARSRSAGDLAVIGAPVDLLGVNYYHPVIVDAAGRNVRRQADVAGDLGADLPAGPDRPAVRLARRLRRPAVVITENGMPDPGPVPPTGMVDDRCADRLLARSSHRRAPRHRGRRPAGGLPRVVTAGQLRVGTGLHPALGDHLRRLRDTAAHSKAQRVLVPRCDRPQRAGV